MNYESWFGGQRWQVQIQNLSVQKPNKLLLVLADHRADESAPEPLTLSNVVAKDVPWQHSIFHISVRLDSLTCPFKIHQPFRESTTDTERVNSSTPSRLVPYIKAAVASDVQVIGMAWRGRTDLYTFFGEEEGFYIYFFSPPQWGFMKNVSSVAAAAAGSNKGCTEEQRHLSLCLRAMVSPQNLFIFNYTLIRLTWVK